MQLRTLGTFAAGFSLWLGSTSAAEPARFPVVPITAKTDQVASADEKVANQRLADSVVAKLQTTDVVSNADLDIFANSGAVTVTGIVGSENQKSAILYVVRRIEGVKLVKDGLTVKAMAATPAPVPAPKAAPQLPVMAPNIAQSMPVMAPNTAQSMPVMAPRTTPQMPVMTAQAVGPLATMAPSAMPPTPMGMPMGNPQIDPVPIGPGGAIMDGAAPPLPPNAWPTYAPYNNVSRVAYPTAYPYNAFPFIGPYYPFPKVPLGWRKVTLEWEDGHWWLGRKQAPIDYWRVKFGY